MSKIDYNKVRENWASYNPPMVPVFFIRRKFLKRFLETMPFVIDEFNLNIMLGYYEEYEMYEEAAIIRDALGIYKSAIPEELEEGKGPFTKEEVIDFYNKVNRRIGTMEEEMKALWDILREIIDEEE